MRLVGLAWTTSGLHLETVSESYQPTWHSVSSPQQPTSEDERLVLYKGKDLLHPFVLHDLI